ncbi:MAG: PTS IIA-like nitrogen regulatory protein PtsN [Gallionellaceae bacterium]
MNLISQILPIDNVILDTESTSKKRVFERVGILFENNRQIARSQVFDSLFAREKLGSTGLGQGVAIPHGRIKNLREAVGAFVKTQSPIPFDAPDGQPVNLIFVLLVPERATDVHLQLLGELAQMFSDKTFREQLQAGNDPAVIHQMFADWKA